MKKQYQPPTPAALYARVSSDRQDVDLSVSAQLSALRNYTKANGFSLPSVGRQNTPGVARAHSHQCRCLLRGHMVRHQTVENLKPCLLFLRQCHMLLHADIFA